MLIQSLYVAFWFAQIQHYLHHWNTRFALLKDTTYTIYTIWNTRSVLFTLLKYTICLTCTIETHNPHHLHYWNIWFALCALFEYTSCTIKIHRLHDLHYWFTQLKLSSHLVCTICTFQHTLFALLLYISNPPYFHNGNPEKMNALLRKLNTLRKQ